MQWQNAAILAGVFLCAWNVSLADQDVRCTRVGAAPIVDGDAGDPVWSETARVTTYDPVADIDHQIKCSHTDREIFVLVKFPDPDENRKHKVLNWDPEQERYRIGRSREDTLVLKWNMEPLFTDISLSADSAYTADIWYWKSMRTDPAGFADDKFQIYSDRPIKKATRLLSKSGRFFHFLRRGDEGLSAYQNSTPIAFAGARIPGYKTRTPQGSRADVRAKGRWADGWWTVEFARRLYTGNTDDVQFADDRRYQFGVSRYEIAGRSPEPDIQVPLFGSGEVGENLFLILDSSRIAKR